MWYSFWHWLLKKVIKRQLYLDRVVSIVVARYSKDGEEIVLHGQPLGKWTTQLNYLVQQVHEGTDKTPLAIYYFTHEGGIISLLYWKKNRLKYKRFVWMDRVLPIEETINELFTLLRKETDFEIH